ncbi:ankyrin repeat-containing protein [Hordeum vulgare]|nr:ankyrin repeat-containing protein [Hordeum vulgare]
MASMDPLLLAAAFSGSPAALRVLLDGEGPPVDVRADRVPTPAFLTLLKHGVAEEEDAAVDITSLQAFNPVLSPSLLEGVTAEGNTALHVVATNGDCARYLQSASFIYTKARHLLHKANSNGDTPLHCAARAGRPFMVSRLIDLARSGDVDDETAAGERLTKFLRRENGCSETALHEAVRIESNYIVELLMAADSELACFPSHDGASPLYLAVLHDRVDIAQTLYQKSGGCLSYSGPDGQNALHAAALRSQAVTEMLLEWNIGLTAQKDRKGSTPLHFATSIVHTRANSTQMYQSDDQGIFPIHIAASTGVNKVIVKFLEKCHNIAGVCDIKGRTFLHIAVEKKKWNIAALACKTPSLSWILNMQDNEGNTALHLSVQLGHQDMFCLLLANKKVLLNLTNKKGETPLDISQSNIHAGCFYTWNPRFVMNAALIYCCAKLGNHPLDRFEEQYIRVEDEEKESKKLTASTQTLGIGSVLIATVAFSANFTLPGDYSGNGMPNLSGRYVFDAFIVANSLAFMCSGLATINLMYAGTSIVDVPLRGLYVVLDPFSHMTSTIVSVDLLISLKMLAMRRAETAGRPHLADALDMRTILKKCTHFEWIDEYVHMIKSEGYIDSSVAATWELNLGGVPQMENWGSSDRGAGRVVPMARFWLPNRSPLSLRLRSIVPPSIAALVLRALLLLGQTNDNRLVPGEW